MMCENSLPFVSIIIPARDEIKIGDYVKVNITRATSGTLFGEFAGLKNIIGESLSLTG